MEWMLEFIQRFRQSGSTTALVSAWLASENGILIVADQNQVRQIEFMIREQFPGVTPNGLLAYSRRIWTLDYIQEMRWTQRGLSRGPLFFDPYAIFSLLRRVQEWVVLQQTNQAPIIQVPLGGSVVDQPLTAGWLRSVVTRLTATGKMVRGFRSWRE